MGRTAAATDIGRCLAWLLYILQLCRLLQSPWTYVLHAYTNAEHVVAMTSSAALALW